MNDKQLLLKDLCARLPYNVIGVYSWKNREPYNRELTGSLFDELKSSWDGAENSEFLPYLRPMSSMTEEEKKDLLATIVGKEGSKYFRVLQDGSIDNTDDKIQDLNKFNMHWINFDKDTVTLYLDWLNKHHFDYRELIKKNLALEAPEGMYKC